MGEESEYRDYSKDGRVASDRMTNPEKRILENTFEDMYRDIRIGAEVHRTVSIGTSGWRQMCTRKDIRIGADVVMQKKKEKIYFFLIIHHPFFSLLFTI